MEISTILPLKSIFSIKNMFKTLIVMKESSLKYRPLHQNLDSLQGVHYSMLGLMRMRNTAVFSYQESRYDIENTGWSQRAQDQ